jgi:3-oxoacyl-(acyl-carrier-protein) synthase
MLLPATAVLWCLQGPGFVEQAEPKKNMSEQQIVITGIGTISSMGAGFESLKQNLPADPHIGNVQKYEFHELDNPMECFKADTFDPEQILGKKGLRTKDWSTKLLLSAMESGFKNRFECPDFEARPGICVGTAFGSVQSIGDFLSDSIVNGVNVVNPQAFANTVINSPAGNANIRYESRSLSSTVSTGFNAGADALLYACDYMKRGRILSMAAGGLEEVSYYSLLGTSRSGVLSASRRIMPFGKEADGWLAGEGCAMFFLETIENAKTAGATVMAEIAGYASAFDPDTFAGAFGSEAAVYTMKESLNNAGLKPSDIGFIAAGANGMAAGDSMEAQAIAGVFGRTPVTAYKSRFGECFGASAALSLACALADMKCNRITGVPDNYEIETDINCIKGVKTGVSGQYAMINAFSCDGYCSSIIVKNAA